LDTQEECNARHLIQHLKWRCSGSIKTHQLTTDEAQRRSGDISTPRREASSKAAVQLRRQGAAAVQRKEAEQIAAMANARQTFRLRSLSWLRLHFSFT